MLLESWITVISHSSILDYANTETKSLQQLFIEFLVTVPKSPSGIIHSKVILTEVSLQAYIVSKTVVFSFLFCPLFSPIYGRISM